MQETSALYQQILEADPHWFETKLVLEEHASLVDESESTFDVTESMLRSVSRDRPGIGSQYPSVGNALSASLAVEMEQLGWILDPMEKIEVYVRAKGLVNGVEETSEWISQGTYFMDTREITGYGTLRITAYDAMLKTEKAYPDTNHEWAYPDIDVLREIAQDIEVTLDQRTIDIVTAGLMIELPADYTEREVLCMIASAYAGNFVISDQNTLLLVPLYGTEDVNITGNYLADDDGETALVLGDEGWFILV